MSREAPTASEPALGAGEIERELDRLSLEQALRDFEVANTRVIELTQRLIDLSHEVTALREQLVGTQEALADSRRENAAIRASATFRVADLVKKVGRRLAR
jgi:hypothetical protein